MLWLTSGGNYMNELIIILTLIIPTVDKAIDWDVGDVPNQMTMTYPSGVQATYSTMMVPCHTKAQHPGWKLYKTKSMQQDVCYLTDTNNPLMARGPWEPTIKRSYVPR
jgi:hypothetical protein